MRIAVLSSVMIALATAPAGAQMSITTIGATDGRQCYENANNLLASDTAPCDKALSNRETTRADLKKTFVNRGIIHNRNGSIVEAQEDFNAALAIDPDLAEAYLNRGNSHFRGVRYEEALADYERSLALDVNKPWAAWYNIGLVYDAQKQTDKAREAYQKALDLNSDFALAQEKLESRP